MNKQKNDILTLCKAGLLTFIFSGLWSASLLAQTVKQTYVNRDATHYYDIEIPSGVEYLYLEVKGGDGGKANVANTKGGEGARASGYVAIGDGSGEIPAGSTLRLTPGQAGLTSKYCSGGGGGSGVAFQAPNTKDWKLLLVAGGGGGAGGWKNGKAA